MATHYMAELFRIDPEIITSLHDIDDEELYSFAELHEDPLNDEQIELYIYACFLIFMRMHSAEHLERATRQTERWIATIASDHQDYARRFQILDKIFAPMNQFNLISEDAELLSPRISQKIIQEATFDVEDIQRSLNNQAIDLAKNYEQTGSPENLNKAISNMEQVVNMGGEYLPIDILNNLLEMLCRRFERTRSIVDFNRTIDIIIMAINIMPQDNPIRISCLNDLENFFGIQYKETGSIKDLNYAIDITNMAVNSTPQDHPNRAAHLSNLGLWLSKRVEQTGSIEDLNRAIDIMNMAVNATAQDHPDRASCLSNLGILLGMQFKWTGLIEDLNRAINIANMAVNATPQDHPDRVNRLSNFGNRLGRRFERTGSMEDLNRAIDVANMAVDASSKNHPDRASLLNNLGNWLGMRFKQTGSIEDLNHAIELANTAIDITPQNYPDRAGRISNLAKWLGGQFEQTDSMEDLDRAIDTANIAVNATRQNHPDRANYLMILGYLIGRRFERTDSMEDLNHMLFLYKEGWRCYNAPPSIRIHMARRAADILTLQLNFEESSLLLQEAVNLLPVISPRSLKHTDKQYMLAEFDGLASMAAATALNAGKDASHALQILELGRNVIAGLLMEMRGDISDLKQQHPELANEFTSLRDELDTPVNRTTSLISTDRTPFWESQARQRQKADQKFSELVIRIRAQSGFDNFLLSPTIDELMAAACAGPIIVINLSSHRCDAFLIEGDRIRVLELTSLTLEEVQKRAQDLQRATSFHITAMLEWLWDAIAHPILESLGFKNPISTFNNSWPRIWWIPTGLLTKFPLHAAGYHTNGSAETVLDRAISSYSSSIKAMIHGRRQRRNPEGPISAPARALLIAMEHTPGSSSLPFATREVEMLHNLCQSMALDSIEPPGRRKQDAMLYLPQCDIFHFAGHGYTDSDDPLKSHLLLEDGKSDPLTVANLLELNLRERSPFLAYLSACGTGRIKNEKFADESIHLISACQLAGYRHVIGTLWEVNDDVCVEMARIIYEVIRDKGMTDEAVCWGLHKAARELRDRWISMPLEAKRRSKLASLGVDEVDDRDANDEDQRDATLQEDVPCDDDDDDGGVGLWVPYVHFGV